MKKVIVFILFVETIFSFNINNYKHANGCFTNYDHNFSQMRTFEHNSTKYSLSVDTSSLKSYIFKNINAIESCDSYQNSKYFILLKFATKEPYPLTNDGVTGGSKGLYLTSDLCPSSKSGFEYRLYKAIIDKFENPAPITIFITKKWALKHTKEFNQLKSWQKDKKLNITWGNHTANHIYHPKVPLKENFVLSKEEHLVQDVLENEKFLIENGLKPSIFFRFPGLVSDLKSIGSVRSLGLIPIGSNAWLAKGEKIKLGSIILVHGNKNEPQGVDVFLKLIENSSIKLDSLNSIE